MVIAQRYNDAPKGIIPIKGTQKSYLTKNAYEGPKHQLFVAQSLVDTSNPQYNLGNWIMVNRLLQTQLPNNQDRMDKITEQ